MAIFRSLLLIALAVCTATAQRVGKQRTTSIDVTGILNLPDGSKFKTTLYGMKIIGQLRTTSKLPYYIMSGTTCTACDENVSIYIHSPSDGPMKDEGGQPRFTHPGEEIDYQTGKTVSKARMFYGDCLPTHPNAVVWFNRTLGDDKKWHDGVLVAEVKEDRLAITELHADLSKPTDAQLAVSARQCNELPGIRSWSEQ